MAHPYIYVYIIQHDLNFQKNVDHISLELLELLNHECIFLQIVCKKILFLNVLTCKNEISLKNVKNLRKGEISSVGTGKTKKNYLVEEIKLLTVIDNANEKATFLNLKIFNLYSVTDCELFS